jgi:hypothetical protein
MGIEAPKISGTVSPKSPEDGRISGMIDSGILRERERERRVMGVRGL